MTSSSRVRSWTLPLLTAATVAVAGTAGCRSPAGVGRAPAADPVPEIERAARQALENERTINPASFPERTVGVTYFSVAATDTLLSPLGYGIADLLLNDLARSRQLQVVDRLRLDALMRETALAQSGATDPATAPRLGRLLTARKMVIGGLGRLPDGAVRIDARVLDVATSRLDVSIDAVASLDRILDAEKALAFQLFDRMGVTLTPAERAAVEQRPTRDIGALLAYGRAVRAEARGDYAGAAGEYEAAAARDPGFTAAQSRAAALRARLPRAVGGARVARAARLRAASLRAAGEVNRSPRGTFTRGDRVPGAADPAFRQAQSSTVVIIIHSTP